MATNESLVFGGVELNDFTNYSLDTLDMPPPPKRPEWATGADTDGAQLVRTPLFGQRTITITLRVEPQASMDTALAKLAAIGDQIEEASRQPDGVALVWTPATGTKSITFYVLEGEITGIPIDITSGWFVRAPKFSLVLTCKPFGYGPEVVGSATSSTAPAMTVTVASVAGDVPAEGRLIVTDAATQARRYVEWGLEQRYYNASTSLLIDSEDLVTSGFAGTQATRTGGYRRSGASNDVVRASLLTQTPVAICGTGNLAHVGTFRVKARVYSTATRLQVRLTWLNGDGPLQANTWTTTAIANDFAEVDLGTISIPPTVSGTQRWTGRIEAYDASATGTTLDVDYLVLVPAGEGYGVARAAATYTPGVATGHDEFNGITAGTALNGRTATAGGTWATSGATTDFTATAPPFHDGVETRSTTSDSGFGRFAILGSTNFTDVEAGVKIFRNSQITGTRQGLVVRWVDASNFLLAYAYTELVGGTPLYGFCLTKVIAGVETILALIPNTTTGYNAWGGIRLTVSALGTYSAYQLDTSGATTATITGQDTALATGGVLATGKPGFLDHGPAFGGYRYYDDFYVGTPAPEPIAIYSGRSLEVRSSDTLRQDSSGTYTGRPNSYRGSRFYIPQAGTAARTSRILVKADRNDLSVSPSGARGDNLTVQVAVTPRYLNVPR